MRHISFTLAFILIAASSIVEAQPAGQVYRIGYLYGGSAAAARPSLEQLQQGLREFGYVEGQNIVVEYRWADGRQERLPELAADLVQRRVDLIVAPGSPAARAAHQATRTIPIVMIGVGDPVALGLTASLARPGGNVTGNASYLPELSAKPLELLKEFFPDLRRLAILWNPANPLHAGVLKDVERPARGLGLQILPLRIMTADDLAGAFRVAAKERASAAWVFGDSMLLTHRGRIAALALDARLPTLGAWRQTVDVGGLMSYGPDLIALYRRGAYYVDRILKGAKPADLPVEQPVKFELVIEPEDRESARPHHPPDALVARGSGDRMSVGIDGASNTAVERPAGSRPLAAAAHRSQAGRSGAQSGRRPLASGGVWRAYGPRDADGSRRRGTGPGELVRAAATMLTRPVDRPTVKNKSALVGR